MIYAIWKNAVRRKKRFSIMKRQLKFYQTMESDVREQQKMIHDFQNHLLCIQGLLEDGQITEAEKYIKQIYGKCRSTQGIYYTNHPIVNSILRQKNRQAEEKGITMILNIGDLAGVIVKDMDLVTVLTNLLDNEIEACERLSKKEKRIYLCCLIEGQELRVSVENPVEQEPKRLGKPFRTSKKNQRKHGIGMENIHRVVEKYQGDDFVACEKGRFLHTVILKNKYKRNT